MTTDSNRGFHSTNKSSEIKDLAFALATAQAEIQSPQFNATNDFFNASYATLGEYLYVIRQVFPKNGLALIQLPITETVDGVTYGGVTTLITHKSGQFIEQSALIPIPTHETRKNGTVVALNMAQEFGKLSTYIKRYAAGGAAAVFQEEDNDGNVGENNSPAAVADLHPGNPDDDDAAGDERWDQVDALLLECDIDRDSWISYCEAEDKNVDWQIAYLTKKADKLKGESS